MLLPLFDVYLHSFWWFVEHGLVVSALPWFEPIPWGSCVGAWSPGSMVSRCILTEGVCSHRRWISLWVSCLGLWLLVLSSYTHLLALPISLNWMPQELYIRNWPDITTQFWNLKLLRLLRQRDHFLCRDPPLRNSGAATKINWNKYNLAYHFLAVF